MLSLWSQSSIQDSRHSLQQVFNKWRVLSGKFRDNNSAFLILLFFILLLFYCFYHGIVSLYSTCDFKCSLCFSCFEGCGSIKTILGSRTAFNNELVHSAYTRYLLDKINTTSNENTNTDTCASDSRKAHENGARLIMHVCAQQWSNRQKKPRTNNTTLYRRIAHKKLTKSLNTLLLFLEYSQILKLSRKPLKTNSDINSMHSGWLINQYTANRFSEKMPTIS